MRRFSCIVCGATETLTFWPDSCSSCGGSLTTEYPVQSEEFDPTPVDDFERWVEANKIAIDDHPIYTNRPGYDNCAHRVVRQWMRGETLTADEVAVLDGLVRQNSVEQLLHLERAA